MEKQGKKKRGFLLKGGRIPGVTLKGLTLRVCGAADHMAQFGFQAGGGGAVPGQILHAARPHRDHALQRRVGPQTLGLVDRQRCGVVNQEPSVLSTGQKREGLLWQNLRGKKTIDGCLKPQKHSWFSTISG